MPKCKPSQSHAAPLAVDSRKQSFDRHAGLLEESRMPWYASGIRGIQRAITVRRLQQDHGTQYVRQLIEHVSRRRAALIALSRNRRD